MNDIVSACATEMVSVGTERKGDETWLLAYQSASCFARVGVPDPDLAWLTGPSAPGCGGNRPSIGAKANRAHGGDLVAEPPEGLSIVEIPYSCVVVVGSACQASLAGVECQGVQTRRMSAEFPKSLTRVGVPHSHSAVSSPGREQ